MRSHSYVKSTTIDGFEQKYAYLTPITNEILLQSILSLTGPFLGMNTNLKTFTNL